MPSRFDYVQYDDKATSMQSYFKDTVKELERDIKGIGINASLSSTYEQAQTVESLNRARAEAITKLEELYMWIGKAIRDDQILRNGSAPLQEERGNS